MPVAALSSAIPARFCPFQPQLFDLASIPAAFEDGKTGAGFVPSPERFSPEQIGFGILSHFCGPEVIDRVLAEVRTGFGVDEERKERCRKLPARLVTNLLLLMGLDRGLSYQKLMVELGDAVPSSERWTPPTATAFLHARQRLGKEVMERLYRAQARPLAEQDLACSFWRGRRVMAIDGTTLPLEDVPELERVFGGQTENGKRVGPPQLRAVSLVECGTRAQVDAEVDTYGTGEVEMAARLERSISLSTLVLADRNFFGVDLWKKYVEGAGADVVWRIKGNVATRRQKFLADGSYLARVGERKQVITVRVIEYVVEGSEEIYRLATNLLDTQTAPAIELARLYADRWEIEISYREIKVFQLEGRSLRSRTEQGVRQEFWSVLTAYNISRRLCYQAAMMLPQRDPDRISFSLAQNRVTSSVKKVPGLQVRRLGSATHYAARLLSDTRHLVQRRDRACPRVVRHKRSRLASRGSYRGPASYPQDRRPDIYLCGAPDTLSTDPSNSSDPA
jgi:hypothetical protein